MPCTPHCGACCDPVSLTQKQAEMVFDAAWGPLTQTQDEDRAFIRAHWAPYAAWGENAVALQCSEYDVATRSCLAYDRRPPVCRSYPFYGGRSPGMDGMGIDRICGYQAEVGRTVLPLVEVNGEATGGQRRLDVGDQAGQRPVRLLAAQGAGHASSHVA